MAYQSCNAAYPGGDVPRCILTWPHDDRLHEDFDGDRWGATTQPSEGDPKQ